MTEHANYPDSIKIQDIVVKTLTNGGKMVGQVLKVYNTKAGQTGLMVKWSDGRFEHVNQANVELLKSEKPAEVKTEKGVVGAILTEAAALAGGITAADVGSHMIIDAMDAKNKKPKKPKLPSVTDAAADASGASMTTKVTGAVALGEETKPLTTEAKLPAVDEALPEEAPEEFVRGVIDTLKELTDLSDAEIVDVAKSAWKEIVAENVQKGANAKDLLAGEVHTTTDISTTAGPGRATSSNVTPTTIEPGDKVRLPKAVGKEDDIEKKPEVK
jgi:hypothetical protein